MKRLHTFILSALAVLVGTPLLHAQPETRSIVVPEINIRLETVGAWQALDIDKNTGGDAPAMTTGLAGALGNLYLFATVVDGIDVFTEFYLSSKHHLGNFNDHEGYVLISRLPDSINVGPVEWLFKYIDLKGGHFEIDYGNQHWVRADNAEVQRNPLVGNYIVDPNVVEGGVEVLGHHDWFHWVAGIGNGVTTEDFRRGRDYSKHGKIMIEPESRIFNLAWSVYQVNHSKNSASESKASLFSGNRSGSRYSGLRPDTGVSDPDFAQLNLGNGQDVLAWQADAGFGWGPVWVSGLYGFFRDADTDGFDSTAKPEDQWTYYGGDVKLNITDNAYFAGRYSGANADDISSVSSKAHADRVQVGYGYHLADGILFKLEYLNQLMEDFPTTGNSSYTRYAGDVRVEGVTMELSVAFGTGAPYEYWTSGMKSQ